MFSFINKIIVISILISLVYPIFSFADDTNDKSGFVYADKTVQSNLWAFLMDHDTAWFRSESAKQIAERVLVYQRDSGGWPKNVDYSVELSSEVMNRFAEFPNEMLATFDNGATCTELFFLAQIYRYTGDHRYVLAFLKGLDYILAAQYKNGGWPQYFPLRRGYYSHITFNDDAMTGILFLLNEIIHNEQFSFVDQYRKNRAKRAIEKGINCILKCQIKVEGELTGWCAQYDEKSLEPRQARSYELVSISGKATVGILRFLMSVENPSKEIIISIQSGIAWLHKVRIEQKRIVEQPDSESPTGFNRIVIHDDYAPPLWARFYNINDNRPFFSDRDGKIYTELSEISSERRNEYGWLGYWPVSLLKNDYPQWLIENSIKHNVLDWDVY